MEVMMMTTGDHKTKDEDKKSVEVVCLQSHPEYVEQSIELLNSEWPRSRIARLRVIEQGSSTGLPTSLILIDKTEGGQQQGNISNDKVLAHCKISPVPSDPGICYVESVVVDRNLRGKGFGRLIMNAMEEFVKTMGIRTVYLTTIDQQKFYEKLGYSLCEPIVVFGGRTQSLTNMVNRNKESSSVSAASLLNSTCIKSLSASSSKQGMTNGFLTSSQSHQSLLQKNESNLPEFNQKSSAISCCSKSSTVPPAPPPPPPKAPSAFTSSKLTKDNIVLTEKDAKVTMRKIL